MYASIGYGGLNTTQILNKLKKLYDEAHEEEIQILKNTKVNIAKNDSNGNVIVRGFSNLLTKFAKCCNPVPGDDIVGYVSRGKGVTVHRADCHAVNNYEFDRLIECEWNNSSKGMFVGSISVICVNDSKILHTISKKLGDNKIQVVSFNSKIIAENKIMINIQLCIKTKEEIDDISQKLLSLNNVLEVFRSV